MKRNRKILKIKIKQKGIAISGILYTLLVLILALLFGIIGLIVSEKSTYDTFIDDIFGQLNGVARPEIKNISLKADSSSIQVIVNMSTDKEQVKNYYYSLDGQTYTKSSNNTYIFKNLKKNTEYTIFVKVENITGLKSKDIIRQIQTVDVGNPLIMQLSQTPASGYNYATKRVIKVDYTKNNATSPIYYLKTSVNATVANETIVEECGTGITPGVCTSSSETTLVSNTWYKTTNSTPSIIYTSEGILYALTSDGTNVSGISTYTISKIDTSVPSTSLTVGTIKTDRATLSATCTDGESGITKYEYSKDNGSTWITKGTTNIYIYTELNKTTNYTFKVRCTNGSGMTNIATSINSTLGITNPTIVQASQKPESGFSYATQRTIKITYTNTNIQSPGYYLKTSVSATVASGTIVEECGTQTTPGVCKSTSVTTLASNTWYKTINTTPSITYTSNGTLYALTSDGKNISGTSTYTVSKIDTSTPSATTITYNGGSNSCTWKNNYNLTLSATAPSGIAHYEVDVDNNGTADANVSSNFIPGDGWSTCTARFRAVSNAGNKGAWTANQHIHMDTKAPVHTYWSWGEVTKDVARLYIQATDTVGLPSTAGYYNGHRAGVYCPTSTASGGNSNWVWFAATWDEGAKAYRCDITPSTFGHYGQTYTTHLYIYDYGGNGGYYNQTTVAIPSVCAYPNGQTWDFGYNGGVQEFTVPCSGTYKLEVWGAQGGDTTGEPVNNSETVKLAGGKGGYSVGNKTFSKYNVIYVTVGGKPSSFDGGYNGGGNAYPDLRVSAAGGGATHIATSNGILRNISSASVLLVAGGGGGSNNSNNPTRYGYGGTGGGTNGGNGTYVGYQGSGYGASSSGPGSSYVSGTAYAGGYGFGGGQTGTNNWEITAGGGGGWYGGGNGKDCGAGGGSGYVGGVSGGTMQNGQRSGNGYARITLISAS